MVTTRYKRRLAIPVALLTTGIALVLILDRCGGYGLRHNAAQDRGPSRVTSANVPKNVAELRQELIRNPSDAGLHEQLSVLLDSEGDMNGAISEIKCAIRLAPRRAAYHANLGYLQRETKRFPDAISSFMKAVQLAHCGQNDKEWMPVYSWEAAKLFQSLGRNQDAEVWYERSLAQLSAYKSEWLLSGMDRRSKTKDFGRVLESDAEKRLASLRAQSRKNRPSREWISKKLPFLRFPDQYKNNRVSASTVQQLESDLSTGKVSGSGLNLNLGIDYLALGRQDDAVTQLLAAIELNPNDAIAWDELGFAYLMQGRLPESSSAFSKAASLGSSGSAQLAERVMNTWKTIQNRNKHAK